MTSHAFFTILAGILVMAASLHTEREKGAGKAGNVLLVGFAITMGGLVWAFGIG